MISQNAVSGSLRRFANFTSSERNGKLIAATRQ
jgi:hypothetical protein